MKSMLKITCLSAACIAALALVSCQKETTPAPEQPSAKTYTLTVDATKGDNVKALSLDGQVLNVKWAATDQVSVFAGDWSGDPMGTLTAAASETGSTTLTGAVTGANKGDNLNFLFPRAEWSYTGQKGILLSDENSIEKKYDYAAAQVTVSEVVGTTITTNTANFTSQQAIVKFTLKNKDGSAFLAADKLTISAASNKLVTNKSYRGTGDKTYYFGDGYYTVDEGSGGFGGEQHGNLVDNNLNNKWCQDKPSGGWYIEFHTASAIKVDGYMLRTGNDTAGQSTRNPQDWVLKGKKNSGDSWTIIDTKSDNHDMPNANYTEKDFDVDVPGEYQYFRLEISDNQGNGGAMQLSEMRLFKYASYEMGTSYGDITVTPDAATSEYTVALRNEKAGVDKADKYTLTATVGTSTYTFEKEGVTFENGKYYSIMVKMQPKKVSSITLNKSSINLLIGGSQTLSVTNVSPDDAVDKSVTWSSSATSVATVNSSTGEVTAVAEGTATITATAHDGSGTTATCTVKVYPEGTVVWDSSNISNLYVSGTYTSYTKEGITLSANADRIDADWIVEGIAFNTNDASGGFTFTAPTGKQFTKIEMTLNGSAGWDIAAMESKLGTGWSYSGDYEIYKVTWTGTASSVGLLTGANDFHGAYVKSIVFFQK